MHLQAGKRGKKQSSCQLKSDTNHRLLSTTLKSDERAIEEQQGLQLSIRPHCVNRHSQDNQRQTNKQRYEHSNHNNIDIIIVVVVVGDEAKEKTMKNNTKTTSK